ncbi:Ctr copper transporter [Polychaeton citri CBS 116435]|uniref:Copper transport protein n=1 Tax=Polychaeton citri CBS 116435 TaxID=1314669 RepID=A0A9P4ULA6_9PEZI|nr:Ctr copper transporter [Polychaeton citri CBS 116435]
MGHSHHMDMDHGDHMMPMCSMNMLFTWSTKNLCIVFSSWRVTGTFSLIASLVAVAALTAGYEAVKEASRRYEDHLAARFDRVARKSPPKLLPGMNLSKGVCRCLRSSCWGMKCTSLALRYLTRDLYDHELHKVDEGTVTADGGISETNHNERSSLLGRALGRQSVKAEEQQGKLIKGVLYGFQVFYSFFIMLLFMTYNGWIMIAVGVGATIGYLLFAGGKTSATKDAACH